MTPEPTPRSSSSCWFPDTYCRPSPSNLVDTGEATTAADCQEECDNTEGCSFFTFLRHRGSPQCSLLSSCTRYQKCVFWQFSTAAPSGRLGAMSPTVVFLADPVILHICEYYIPYLCHACLSKQNKPIGFSIFRLNDSEQFAGPTGALLVRAVPQAHQGVLATGWTGVCKAGKKG